MSRINHAVRVAAVTVIGALAIMAPLACSDDDSSATATEGTGDTATEQTEIASDPGDATDAGSDESGDVEVLTVDYAFQGLPTSVPAGTRFHLSNDSDKELHEMVLMRINDDESRPAAELVQLPADQLDAVVAQPPAMVSLVMPRSDEMINAVGDASVTEPGRYLVICSIPTGADPVAYMEAAQQSPDGPPDVPGGPPHLVNGMWAEVTVG